MEDSMVERVARAISAAMDEGFPRFTTQKWGDLTELARQAMRHRARAAIEAMREPTAEVAHAGFKRLDGLDDLYEGDGPWAGKVVEARHIAIWHSMIDAALSPTTAR